jgi:hypothetical protein
MPSLEAKNVTQVPAEDIKGNKYNFNYRYSRSLFP